MMIIGAGLAGLLAGSIFQRAHIFESGPESQLSHKAVLRFRTSAVGEAIGIDFRPVLVHKGIWLDGKFVRPSIQLANQYSRKVIGKLADRSIWNMEPADRFIAPENLVQQLAERCHGRINWCVPVNDSAIIEPGRTISTAPMPALARLLLGDDLGPTAPIFEAAPIEVRRYRVRNADVFETIYFPWPGTNLYRATITGSLLIMEFMAGRQAQAPDTDFAYASTEALSAFGLTLGDVEPIDSARQRFGKIAPIDEQWRRQFVLQATLQHGVYSLGRFATWRNILLDDVLHDIGVIKRLISGGAYAATRKA